MGSDGILREVYKCKCTIDSANDAIHAICKKKITITPADACGDIEAVPSETQANNKTCL